MAAPTPTTTSVSKTAVHVGLFFLAATFTFAIGNASIPLVLFECDRPTRPHRRGVPSGLLRLRGRCQRGSDAANPQAVYTGSFVGLPRAEDGGVPHTRGSGRVLLDKPWAVGCVRACRLRGFWCRGPRPIVCLADIEDRAEGAIRAGSYRLSGLLGRKHLGHVQLARHHTRRRDACARPRRPLRVGPPIWLFTRGFTSHQIGG